MSTSNNETLEMHYFQHLYHLADTYAASIRLVGADDEYFAREKVHLRYYPMPYLMPGEFASRREEVLKQKKEQARLAGSPFFNGPHTRLIDYRFDADEVTEQKHLDLILGPIDWYDYSAVEEILNEVAPQRTVDQVSPYIDLDQVAYHGSVRNVSLPNIVDAAITPVTLDGHLIYSKRSLRVSTGQGQLSSGGAENIQRNMDWVGEAPDPFLTVLRGIQEEFSPLIRDHVDVHSIYLLGIDFDLDKLHPDLLFLIVLPLSFEQLMRLRRERPGKDFVEGRIASTPTDSTSQDLRDLLMNRNWVPGGKASVIRTVEFLEAIQRQTGLTIREIIASLANGQVPSKGIQPVTTPATNYADKVPRKRKTNASLLKEKIVAGEFDAFLAHNHLDKPQVEKIAARLKRRGLYPWIDKEQVRPGKFFQDEIQRAIPQCRSLVIFIGTKGLGDWQRMELHTIISQCVESKKPVIPVLLPDVDDFPHDLLFLKELQWVRFDKTIEDKEALYSLEWGIRGQKRPK